MVMNDQPIAMAGVMMGYPLQVFSVFTNEAKKHKRLIVKYIPMFKELLGEYGMAFAKPSPDESTAVGFLKHVGFVDAGEGVYLWNP